MKTIRLNGKDYPCRVTMGAMLRFKSETGRDVSRMDSGDAADLTTFLWCCIVSACKADGVQFDMALMDFADGLAPGALSGFYGAMEEEAAGAEKKTRRPTS